MDDLKEDYLPKLEEWRLELSAEASEEYSGMVMDTAEKTVAAKVTGRPTDDPDGRRGKRQERDRRVLLKDIAEQALAGVAPRHILERTIGSSDFLKIDYFVKGLVAARSVGRIDALGGAYFGSGFLCGPGMVMTNHHVLPSENIARKTHIGFETYDGLTVIPKCRLDPDTFWWTNKELDISIVALDPERGRTISDRLGWHPLIAEQGKVALGDPAAIIQYPEGRLKSVVLHEAMVIFLKDHRTKKVDRSLWYTCDTEPGSSGSPVFNKHWEVVAVHHASVPARDDDGDLIDEDGQKVSDEGYRRDPNSALYVANKGIRASRIVAALKDDPFDKAPHHIGMKTELLDAWSDNLGQRDVLMKMRARISQEWASSMSGVDDEVPRFIAASHERSSERIEQGRDFIDTLLDRAGPHGRVELTVVRGPGSNSG